jgi:opacity protein-like surface antigen
VGRHFLLWCIGIIALSWFGCGSGAAAIVTNPFLDPQTMALVHQAHGLAHHIHGHHFFDDEASSYEDHCEAHDRYNQLSAKYWEALYSGNLVAAKVIGDALGDLGEEMGYDEYLADEDFGGYDSCFCRVFDGFFGPHSAFLDIQYGYSGYRWGVEDFSGTQQGSLLGIGGGFSIPLTQRLYGFVRLGAYDTFASRIDLFSPNSDFSARTQWLVTAEAGLGVPISDRFGVRASGGFALADMTVFGPGGVSDSKAVPGYTLDAGIDVKFAPRWKLTFDARFTQLQETNFSPLPAVNLAVSERIWATTIGVRYELGNTARNRIW